MALQLNKLLHARDVIRRFVATKPRRTMHLRAGTNTYNHLGVALAQRERHTLEAKNGLLERLRALAQMASGTGRTAEVDTIASSQAQRLKNAIDSLRHETAPASTLLLRAGLLRVGQSNGLQLGDAPKPEAIARQPVRDLLEEDHDVFDSDHRGANLADTNRAFEQAQKAKTTFVEKHRTSFRAQSSMISLRWSQVMLQL